MLTCYVSDRPELIMGFYDYDYASSRMIGVLLSRILALICVQRKAGFDRQSCSAFPTLESHG